MTTKPVALERWKLMNRRRLVGKNKVGEAVTESGTQSRISGDRDGADGRPSGALDFERESHEQEFMDGGFRELLQVQILDDVNAAFD